MKKKPNAKNSREEGFRYILAEALMTRGLLLLAGLYAAVWIPFYDAYYRGNFHYHQESVQALDAWARWNSEWYLYIADKGYTNEDLSPHYQDATSGFFPLYPMLIRFLGAVLGHDVLAGLLISNISLLVFLWILLQLGKEKEMDEAAYRGWPGFFS